MKKNKLRKTLTFHNCLIPHKPVYAVFANPERDNIETEQVDWFEVWHVYSKELDESYLEYEPVIITEAENVPFNANESSDYLGLSNTSNPDYWQFRGAIVTANIANGGF